MFKILATLFGALCAVIYVGFFAYKVDKLPLIVIVAVCLGLMVYSFYDDLRNDRTIAQIRAENDKPQ